ncbi:pyridoxamine 5'-phosphate oxidase family protein [Leptolyngbya sp. AN02str]|uniref:pyridoxamine 5'-phosphate oxidase family protein n=1 Tax=Leptolyngbya sp. AN02str TaxID=3423363 RepID=UPI003D31C1E2
MAKLFDHITDELRSFIAKQQMFFVATAPLSNAGHVNLSPKGLDSFRVLSPHRVAYLDLTGSGNETSAHLLENGRITLMFCAFSGSPLILRLYGQGEVILPNSAYWNDLASHFPPLAGARQIILVQVERVQTSCGMGVPMYESAEQRELLTDWATKKGKPGLKEYHQLKNRVSIDGLPTPLMAYLGE